VQCSKMLGLLSDYFPAYVEAGSLQNKMNLLCVTLSVFLIKWKCLGHLVVRLVCCGRSLSITSRETI
jgi:hypothetical protein